MGAPKVYNGNEVTLLIGDVLIDSGLGDSEFLSYESAEDDITSLVGADGEVAISKTNNPLVNFDVSVLQTSEANDVFSGMRLLRRAPGNAGVAPYTVRDRNGRTLHEGKCWVRKSPTVTMAKSATVRQWAFSGVEDYGFDGGNLSA